MVFACGKKSLEKARFKWPRKALNEVITLTGQQLKLAFGWTRYHAHAGA